MPKYTLFLPALAVLAPSALSAQEIAEDNVQGVFERARPDYAAHGVDVGAFVVQPSVEVEAVHDDNIFASPSNEESDIITVISPSVGLKSKWLTHSVEANVGARTGTYADFSDEDFQDYHADIAGRVDINRGQYIDTNVSYDRGHEDRTSPDDVNGNEPTKIDSMKAGLGFTREVSKVSLKVGGQAERLDYKHVDALAGTVITNSERDRVEYGVDTKLGYEYIPNYSTYVQGRYEVRKYDILSAVNRDSDGYNLALGTDVNVSGKIKGDAYVGYITREYDDPSLDSISNVDFGGSLLWNMTQLTSLRGGVQRTIEETIQAGASGYIDSTVSLGVEHELRRNVLLGLEGEYANQDFQGGTLDRSDNIYGGGLGVTYLLPYRGLSVSAGYGYSERISDSPLDEYTDNRFMLTLGGKL